MLKITLRVTTQNLKIKKSLSKLVSSAIYSILDDEKHDGFLYKNKIFKDCVFSSAYYEKERYIEILFNSLDDESLKQISLAVLNNSFQIGDIVISESSVASIEDFIDTNNSVMVGESSVLLYRTVNGKREYIFGKNSNFISMLKNNLMQKYYVFNNKNYEGEISIKILNMSKNKKCFYFGKFPYFAKRYTLMIHADENMLKLIAKTGIGSGNMKGFGFMKLVDLGD